MPKGTMNVSTSFLGEAELRNWALKLGLRIDLITSDPYADDAEYRIHVRVDGRTPEAREVLFYGSLNRCSDFIRGYLRGH